ncbi:carboxyl transferase domain-containing protein [Gordonia sp. SL306]|uniref:carboxyl transferase domain-containing protein n=1 Tax=Gordonia sp. SL306 TaxID=2995145 RepID=UPI00226F7873|nr:carboxyl transferase domain-containing protein [Gordonia sp. SL306]WAC54440.1 carboxyl transferase [Gordonia sp. SL306]
MTDRPRADAFSLVESLFDQGTFEAWDAPVGWEPADPGYRSSLARAHERTGLDESVVTGSGRVNDVRVAVVVSEFGFLGGSIGRSAGQRVVAAIERATRERIPVLALPASGGTRMQEGTAAFLQMVAITGAVNAHKAAGLPYLVYLRHPTTGGVFASWGSLGHVTWAEPSALVGFLGPRVYEGLYGEPFPENVQTSENLHRRGLVDSVVPAERLGGVVGETLAALSSRVRGPDGTGKAAARPISEPSWAGTAWEAVLATRARDRPGLTEFLAADGTVILRGDAPLWLALHSFGGSPAVVIGHDRRKQAGGALIGPVDLRVARRGMAMASELGLPVVTVIDTPGAELSVAAEEAGLASEIARCTAELVSVPVPTVSVLLGQGAGGAALALFPTDRRIAATDAWLSPLPPEGASLIVHRDTDHAAELAADQGIAAGALYADDTVDLLVDVTAPDGMTRLRSVIAAELASGPTPSDSRRTRVPGGRG